MVIAKSGYYHNKYTCNWHLLKPGVFYLSKWHIQTFGILTSEKPVDIIQVRKQEQKKRTFEKEDKGWGISKCNKFYNDVRGIRGALNSGAVEVRTKTSPKN